MPTRNVVLTERQDTLVDALVRSGRYQNASEVLREGLRLVEGREIEDATKLEALRVAADKGLSALERGEFREFADASALITHLSTIAQEAVADTESQGVACAGGSAWVSRRSTTSRTF